MKHEKNWIVQSLKWEKSGFISALTKYRNIIQETDNIKNFLLVMMICAVFSACDPAVSPQPDSGVWGGVEDTSNWDIRIHNGDYDQIVGIATNSRNFVYILGSSTGIAGKTELSGWWIKCFTSSGDEIITGCDKRFMIEIGNNQPSCIVVDSDDNILVGGSFYKVSSGNELSVIKKFRSDGIELFSTILPDANFLVQKLVADADGNIYACFQTMTIPHQSILVKLDNQLAPLWKSVISVNSISSQIEATAIDIDSSHNVIVGGSGFSLAGPETGYDSWYQKFSPDGQKLQEVVFTAEISVLSEGEPLYSNDYVYSLAVDDQNNVYTAGSGFGIALVTTIEGNVSIATPCQCHAGWLNRFSPTGQKLASKVFLSNDTCDCDLRSVIVDSEGRVFVAGSDRYADDKPGSFWLIAGVDMAWDLFWSAVYDTQITTGYAFTAGTGLALDTAGALYSVSTANNVCSSTSELDWWIKKFQ